jgi:hypothetical protein
MTVLTQTYFVQTEARRRPGIQCPCSERPQRRALLCWRKDTVQVAIGVKIAKVKDVSRGGGIFSLLSNSDCGDC